MTREIKFRAWDKKEKKMIYAALEIRDIGLGEGSVLVDERTQLGNELKWMQYTGLKDKNGKEIYEGDIMEIGNKSNGFVKSMPHNGEYALVRTKRAKTWYSLGVFLDDATKKWTSFREVIGNIYENLELLKGGKDE